MRFIAWNRLQWLPPLWGVAGAITFLLVPLLHDLSFFASLAFVLVGGGLLLFIVKLPLTYGLGFSPSSGRQALQPVCLE